LQDARSILDNGMLLLGSSAYDSLGVKPILEQTADLKEGGSHTARFGSVELLYAEKAGDTSRIQHAVRQLDWATYLVDFDGKVRFSPRNNSIWYTDGYGDFVRHFIRAMGWYPAIAFDSSNHLIRSSSVVKQIAYNSSRIAYTTYDSATQETLRLTQKPMQVKASGIVLNETASPANNSWWWQPAALGGVLKVHHSTPSVEVLFNLSHIADTETPFVWQLRPNPAHTTLTIQAENAADAHFYILNNLGAVQPIKFVNKNNGEIEADVSTLPQGSYQLVAEYAQKRSVKKWLKF